MVPQDRPDRFSVVIPVYNKAAVLERAIDSVRNQRGVEVEILCIDDGSTDGSSELLDAYGNRIRVIHQENRGPSAARNRGIEEASRSWLAFLDADDSWDREYLAAVAAVRRFHPDIRFTLASYRVVEAGRTETVDLAARPLPWQAGPPPRATHSGTAFLAVGMASGGLSCSRELLREVGGFDEGLKRWEIADLVFRLLCAAGSAGVVEKPLVTIHRDPADSQWLRGEGDVLAHARLARNQISAALQVTRPEGSELRAAAAALALRAIRGLARNGNRTQARELLALLPTEGPRAMRWFLRAGIEMPTPLQRLLATVWWKVSRPLRSGMVRS